MSQAVPLEVLHAEKAAIDEISRAVAGLLRTLRSLPYGTPVPAAADTITIPRPVALLLADLLDRAADEFLRHCCNDYIFPDEAAPAREAILRAYATWSGNPDAPANPGDDALMAVGAAILRDPGILEAGR